MKKWVIQSSEVLWSDEWLIAFESAPRDQRVDEGTWWFYNEYGATACDGKKFWWSISIL
jgi:hypothetical protein